jgi:hypothetical protein
MIRDMKLRFLTKDKKESAALAEEEVFEGDNFCF